MLPLYLRVILIVAALCALAVVSRQVKKERLLIEDAVFWVVAAVILVIVAIFPSIAINLAYALGFMSASNFVYMVIIALLLWKVFACSSEISRLKVKVNELAQEIALDHLDERAAREELAAKAGVAVVEKDAEKPDEA